MKHYWTALSTTVLVYGFASHAMAHGEFVVSAFTGLTSTMNDDIELKQPNEDVTLHDARLHGRDFGSPPYYGGRVTYFLNEHQSGWGFGMEFFHPKVYLDTGDTLHVTGEVGGVPVNANQPAATYFNRFNNSHGLNFLTFEGIYRYYIADPEKTFWGRFQPYAGGGLAMVIPHVESNVVGGADYESYELAGPGIQGMVGLNFELTHWFSIFSEYKLTYVSLDESIPGGSIKFDPLTHAVVMGVSFHF